MKQSPVIFGLGATALSISACASPVGTVRQAVASAPEWYQEARVEIRGEGYPDVSRVVALEHHRVPPEGAEATRVAVADAEAEFLRAIGGGSAAEDLERALAWAAAQQAAFNPLVSSGDFLTEDDIRRLRAVFDVQRAKP